MSAGTATADEGRRRATAWVAHLRTGGTTPWSSWQGEAEPIGRALPSAQQLELLRRLNEAGRPSEAMVHRVLTASAPGRGSPDLQLAGAVADSPFGPRPVDPGRLHPAELLRVVTGLLAEDLVAAPLAAPPRPTRRRPWRRSSRLAGDPAWVHAAREHPARRVRLPSGRRPLVVVLGAPLDRMLADLWTERCFDSGAPRWGDWLARWEHRRALPPRVDLPAVADSWASRVGADRVQVVLAPAAGRGVHGIPARPTPVAACAAELGRRTAPVLGLLVPREERSRRLRELLLPLLAAHGGPPPGVPPERLDWVQRRARRMSGALTRGDYAVVGDPALVLPPGSESPGPVPSGAVPSGAVPSGSGALDLGIRVLLEGGLGARVPELREERA